VAALGSLDDAVTALRLRAFAGAPLALEPELEPTLRIAPVEVFGVAVVAALVRIDDAVAAQVDARTRLPGGSAREALLDEAAARGAAIAGLGVPVVARFPRADDAVPTHDRRDARLTRSGTLVELLDDAATGAPITGQAVAVVARFWRVEVDEPVATSRVLRDELALRLAR